MSAHPPPSALRPHHRAELVDGSGINPLVIAQRGYRSATAGDVAAVGYAPAQCGDGLLIPQWTLAGVQRGWLLKREQPRLDAKGKAIKYEAPFGSVPHWDVHPDARHLLRDVAAPVYFTEGVKKSDSAWSRGLLGISITSVWMFLNGRLVVPDLDEIPLPGRMVRVVFDSDVMTKSSVAEALHRFCALLHRRGATVERIVLPHPAQGKCGLDDFFVAGGTVAALDALAQPWDGRGPGIWLRESPDSDVAALQRDLAQARADAAVLVQMIRNPEITRAQLVAAVTVATEVQAKAARGEVTAEGTVILSNAEISGDWRPKPAHGERAPTVNPTTGSRPRMARSNVRPIMREAIAHDLIDAAPVPARRADGNGIPYEATDWAITPSPSLGAALAPWVAYRADAPKQRKPRTLPVRCPECGAVPERITQRDYYGDCGTLIEERIIENADIREPAATGDKLSPVGEASSPPLLVLNGRRTISRSGNGHGPLVTRIHQRTTRAAAYADLASRAPPTQAALLQHEKIGSADPQEPP